MLARKLWHKSLTDEVISEAFADQMAYNPGFCLICGTQADGVEPDACNYRCESCSAEQVFGVEELLLAIAL